MSHVSVRQARHLTLVPILPLSSRSSAPAAARFNMFSFVAATAARSLSVASRVGIDAHVAVVSPAARALSTTRAAPTAATPSWDGTTETYDVVVVGGGLMGSW